MYEAEEKSVLRESESLLTRRGDPARLRTPGEDSQVDTRGVSPCGKEARSMICKHYSPLVSLSLLVSVLFLAFAAGCKPSPPSSPAGDDNATAQTSRPTAVSTPDHVLPEHTVTEFLTALKGGDDAHATSLLTSRARQEMERANAAIKPPGSPTAEFQVTEVQYIGEAQEGAHVLSSWVDTETDGTRQSYEIVWILRQENGGWAIAGMATQVFEDQPPLILNFEDPEDAQQKREAVDQEIARRAEEPIRQQAQRTAADGSAPR